MKRSLTRTIVVGIIFLVAILEVGAASIGYIIFTDVGEEQYKDYANFTAQTAAKFIDVSTLETHLETQEKDDAYLQIESTLQTMADNDDCDIIYVAVVDTSTKTRTYIYDVVSEDSELYPYEIGYTDTAEESFLEEYQSIASGQESVKNTVYGESEILGAYSTSIVPLKNENGDVIAICGVVRTMDSLVEGRHSYLQQLMIWAVLIAIVSVAIGIYIFRRTIVHPIQTVVDETKRFSNTRDVHGKTLYEVIDAENEIGYLARSIDEMENSIVQSVDRLVEVTAKQNRVDAELEIAQKIQSNALPNVDMGIENVEIDAIMDPAKEIGGDFYDCFIVDENHLALVIADVSGKGIPAALLMMVAKMLIKTMMLEYKDPSKVFEVVNEKLCENNESSMFVTAWLGLLDIQTGELVACNAGHEYPILKKDTFEVFKDKHSFVLGGMEGMVYPSYTLQLEKNDVLFLYTDGLPEAIDRKKEQFGLERVLHALNRGQDKSVKDIISNVILDVGNFVEDEEQFDDTTMLCIRFKGQKRSLTLEADVKNIDRINDFIDQEVGGNLDMKSLTQIHIATDEIVNNIASYAYDQSGDITIEIEIDKGVQITFIDHGKPYNPLQHEDPDVSLDAESRHIGGLGIYLTKQLMDDVAYEFKDHKNYLTIKKNPKD